MAEKASYSVVGICGSLRKASFNAATLRFAQSVAPANLKLAVFDRIGEFPLYNGDDEKARGLPAPVVQLADAIKAADGVLIVTPEYNFSVPGVLKNAIDWLSRPQPQPFVGKPVCVMGAAMGPLGTGRAQYDLRRMLVFLDAVVMNKPEIFISLAHTKFNDKGELTDETAKGLIKQSLENFVGWMRKHG
jgi:chromate reductase